MTFLLWSIFLHFTRYMKTKGEYNHGEKNNKCDGAFSGWNQGSVEGTVGDHFRVSFGCCCVCGVLYPHGGVSVNMVEIGA